MTLISNKLISIIRQTTLSRVVIKFHVPAKIRLQSNRCSFLVFNPAKFSMLLFNFFSNLSLPKKNARIQMIRSELNLLIHSEDTDILRMLYN